VKIQFQAKKMINPEIEFVSLVGRAANRIPFRVYKEDKGDNMTQQNLDLAALFTTKKAEGNALKAVITTKGEGEGLKTKVSSALGVPVVAVKSSDEADVLCLTSEDGITGDVVKLTDDLAVVVAKGFSSYAGTSSFAKNIKSASFYPNFHTAMSVLEDTMYTLMYESDGTDTKAEVDTLMGDFSKYVATLVSALPTTAFKLEKALKEDSSSTQEEPEQEEPEQEETASEEPVSEGQTEAEESGTEEPKQDAEDQEASSDSESSEPEGDNAEEQAPESEFKPTEKSEEPNAELVQIAKGLTSMVEAVTALGDQVKSISQKSEDLNSKVVANEKALADALESLNGLTGTEVHKSDTDGDYEGHIQRNTKAWEGLEIS
jgi:hypothetical protein